MKTTPLTWQRYVQNYPKESERVGKVLPIKRQLEKRLQNLCRTCFNFHDESHLFPNNIISTGQMNVPLIESCKSANHNQYAYDISFS